MELNKIEKHLNWLFSESKVAKPYNKCNPNLPQTAEGYFAYWVDRIKKEYPSYLKTDSMKNLLEEISDRIIKNTKVISQDADI